MSATEINATIKMLFVINKFNRESNNKYNFRMVQVVELQKQTADYITFTLRYNGPPFKSWRLLYFSGRIVLQANQVVLFGVTLA